jgi:hypothetical protein
VQLSAPLIRLYDFTRNELAQLYEIISSLSVGAVISVALHEQKFISPVQGLSLTLNIGKDSRGIEKTGDNKFVCTLTQEYWDDELERMKAAINLTKLGHYHWMLWNTLNEARLLISWNGTW